MTKPPLILAHGGAGKSPMTKAQRACLAEALASGYELLRRGAPSIDAVETTIKILEGSGVFNAGVGSCLQLDGSKRMDASIMEGRDLRAGAVAGIELVRHPISAARLVMEETAHVLLVGPSATRFARHWKLDRQSPPTRAQQKAASVKAMKRAGLSGAQRRTLSVFAQMQTRSRREARDTVGAVALDRDGTAAAGASTGGIALMLPGRVGDTPLIGCGVYADNEAGAVSMTGLGEGIIRLAVAKEIADRLAGGASPVMAVRLVLAKLATRVQGRAGALVLAKDGRFAIAHNTARMTAGYWNGSGKPVVKDKFER
ncbi:MAG: peptidase T [Nitrospira sp.]|nr:peptidase T [Nitrospira sp.]